MGLVRCNNCGTVLDESSDIPLEKRTPCPSCGSKSRLIEIEVGNGITTPHSKLRMQARHGTTGRPFYEAVTGDDLHRKTGQWMRLERIIDRMKNYYKEVVIDPKSGQVVHKCEEPLSQHRVHGSAKLSKNPKSDE